MGRIKKFVNKIIDYKPTVPSFWEKKPSIFNYFYSEEYQNLINSYLNKIENHTFGGESTAPYMAKGFTIKRSHLTTFKNIILKRMEHMFQSALYSDLPLKDPVEPRLVLDDSTFKTNDEIKVSLTLQTKGVE